ncbi:MAG: hypothetical protein Q7R60_03385 [bacterium]|nr:hypothetical protein [bacterium]
MRVNLSVRKLVPGLGLIIAALAMVMALGIGTASAGKACATIQGGSITDTSGNPLSVGYDVYGYNYQAHMFNGTYDSSDRVLDGMYWSDPASVDYADDSLIMKWSDPWLANVDCNADGKLDRGLVNGVVGGTSLGWLTNQINGDYTDGTGSHHYTWFDKIVWVGSGGSLWGQYQIIQEVVNDPAGGLHGLQFKVGAPGLGLNDAWTMS